MYCSSHRLQTLLRTPIPTPMRKGISHHPFFHKYYSSPRTISYVTRQERPLHKSIQRRWNIIKFQRKTIIGSSIQILHCKSIRLHNTIIFTASTSPSPTSHTSPSQTLAAPSHSHDLPTAINYTHTMSPVPPPDRSPNSNSAAHSNSKRPLSDPSPPGPPRSSQRVPNSARCSARGSRKCPSTCPVVGKFRSRFWRLQEAAA